MRKRNQDKRIFFPWERRGSLARRLGLQRARPFVWIGGLLCVLIVIGVRERRAAGERRAGLPVEAFAGGTLGLLVGAIFVVVNGAESADMTDVAASGVVFASLGFVGWLHRIGDRHQ